MPRREQFPFVEQVSPTGARCVLPFVPIGLELGGAKTSALALLDTGAAINVLPYDVGLLLNAKWEQQTITLTLTGALENEEARALVVTGTIDSFSPIRLAFAWMRSNSVPVILGQMNFFLEFDKCFYRSRAVFELQPK